MFGFSLSAGHSVLVLVVVGLVGAGLSLLARRTLPLDDVRIGPWSSTLSYVATAYGIVVGFSILYLFGAYAEARQAVGNEATSIGTAFEEARLFGDDASNIQRSLICYGQGASQYDWPAMREGTSAPEVDSAYTDIILALGEADEPLDGTFQPATATNLLAQVGSISTARESRLVAAQTSLPVLMWGLLLGGGSLVLIMIFAVTLPAAPVTQAVLVGLASAFTAVMVLLVVALNNPFAPGPGRVSPSLIDDTVASMTQEAPAAAATPCDGQASESS